jgi:glycosyltransferase involved in cell wall biosynthesis
MPHCCFISENPEMPQIRILYLVSALKRCGPINQLYNLIKYLDRKRYDVSVVTLSPEPADSRLGDFEMLGIHIVCLGLGKLESIFRATKLLMRYIQNEPAAIIHSSGFRADWIVARCCRNFRTVATIRNCPSEDYGYHLGWLGRYGIAPFHLNLLRRIKTPVVVSRLLSKKLADQHGFTCDFIQNGVDQDIFSPLSEPQKPPLRRHLKLPAGDRLFVVVGHLNKLKDPLCAAQGFLEAAVPNSRLIFIGNGILHSKLQRLCKSDKIILTGRTSNIQPWLQASDFLISASHTEGLPNAVLEAMACGLPCILSDIPAHREILDYQPQAGMLFPVGDITLLAERIRNAAQQPYDTQRKAALEIIEKYLSAKRMSQQYQFVYEKMLLP